MNCKGWHQEAAMGLLIHYLDPDVAEKSEELIVYAGTLKAARNHECLERIISTPKHLENDVANGYQGHDNRGRPGHISQAPHRIASLLPGYGADITINMHHLSTTGFTTSRRMLVAVQSNRGSG